MKPYRIPMTALRMVKERTLSLPRTTIEHAEHAAQVATAVIGDRPNEHLIAMMLDGVGNVTRVVTLSVGGMSGAAVTARDVLRAVLTSHAHAFILAHNHPSGDPTPSREDLAMTQAIRGAAAIVGVPLLDHVVITRNGNFRSVEA
jgi:DNA repair protein RadC